MFQKTSDSVSLSPWRGAVTPNWRQIPGRVLVAYRLISLLPSRPAIDVGRNGAGRKYSRLLFGNQYLYLGDLDEQSRRLLLDHIERRWPVDTEIRSLTSLRRELRQKAAELAVLQGFRFRGHEIRRKL